jgi:hypothetical protein
MSRVYFAESNIPEFSELSIILDLSSNNLSLSFASWIAFEVYSERDSATNSRTASLSSKLAQTLLGMDLPLSVNIGTPIHNASLAVVWAP